MPQAKVSVVPRHSIVEHSRKLMYPLEADLLSVCIPKWPRPLNLRHVINHFPGEQQELCPRAPPLGIPIPRENHYNQLN